jgi:hypothetical protein
MQRPQTSAAARKRTVIIWLLKWAQVEALSGESINLGAPVRFLVWGPPSITSEPPLLDGNLPSNYRGPRNGFLLICEAPERRSGAFWLTFTTGGTYLAYDISCGGSHRPNRSTDFHG